MFRAAYRSSPGALTVFAASGLYTHVVTGRSPHAYVNQRLRIQLELLMMSGSMNGGLVNSVAGLHLVGISTESYYDARIHEY